VQPEIHDHHYYAKLCERENQKPRTKRNRNEQSRRTAIPNALMKVVDLWVETRIRIDAMEQILVKMNPVAYEPYLGTIENLRAEKAAEVKQVLTHTFESQPAES
jgi:hypothetical protein